MYKQYPLVVVPISRSTYKQQYIGRKYLDNRQQVVPQIIGSRQFMGSLCLSCSIVFVLIESLRSLTLVVGTHCTYNGCAKFGSLYGSRWQGRFTSVDIAQVQKMEVFWSSLVDIRTFEPMGTLALVDRENLLAFVFNTQLNLQNRL